MFIKAVLREQKYLFEIKSGSILSGGKQYTIKGNIGKFVRTGILEQIFPTTSEMCGKIYKRTYIATNVGQK